MTNVVAAMVRSARRSMSFTGKELQETVEKEDSKEQATSTTAKSPEPVRKETKDVDHKGGSTVASPPASSSATLSPTSTTPSPPTATTPPQSRSGRQLFSAAVVDDDDGVRFDYETIRQSPTMKTDPYIAAFDVPSTLELISLERKRRYPLPAVISSLLKEPNNRPYIKYCLNFFINNWRVLRPRPEVTLRVPHATETPGAFLPLDEKDATPPPASDTASREFIDALGITKPPLATIRERAELLSVAAVVSPTTKGAADALPFAEAPATYRCVQVDFKDLKMSLGDFEPFYCQFALYDLTKKVRLSEVYHWEVQPSETAVNRPMQRAVFSLSYPSPDICLIVRIEKILQADVDAVVELYAAPDKAKDRDREKLRRDVKDLIAARGKQASQFRQLFAYGMLPLFNDDRTLAVGEDIAVRPLFRPSKGDLNDATLFSLISERGGSLSLKRLRSLPGQLTVTLTELFDVPPKRLDVSLESCGGATTTDDSPVEVQEFSFVPRASPHTFLVNNLYVYLDSVNLAGRMGAASAKNICVKVQLLPSDKPNTLPLNAIYGRDKNLTTAYYSSIQYHNKQPLFYDEIKVKLPLPLTTSHHLLFTFLHVSGKAREPETIVGYSVLPVLSNEVLMASKENSLPVIAEILPPNYLSPEAEDNIKYLDNKRPLLKCRIALVSSVYTQDDTLARALSAIDYVPELNTNAPEVDRHLSASLRFLRLVSPSMLLSFLPPLLTHLIALLSWSSVQREVFSTLNEILYSLYLEATGAALSQAISHAEFVAAPTPPVHEDITRFWSEALRSHDSTSAGEKLVVFSGFWFRLIVKSMAALTAKPRKYADGYAKSVRTLVSLLTCEMSSHARTTLNLAKDLNRNLAMFLRDLFELMDRGFVYSVVERVMNLLSTGVSGTASPTPSVLCDLKCDFLKLIAESPYYLPLNLPVPHPLPADNLLTAWTRHHPLAALLLRTVESYVTAADRPMRSRAVLLLLSVMTQHELDTRCTEPAARDRVALLYLPWLAVLGQHWEFISLQYSFEEKRRVLLTWLFVSNSLSLSSLMIWWRAAPLRHQAAYLQALVACAQTFEFAGAAKLAELAAERPEVDKSSEAKAQLESYYTKQLAAANPRERFSNLRQRRAELRAADAEGVSDRPARGHMRTPSGGGVAHMRVSRPPSALHSSAINPNEKGSAIASAAPINSEAHERLLAATVAQTLAMLADSTFDFILQSGASLRSPKRDPLVDGAVDLVAALLSRHQTLSLLHEVYALLCRHMPRLGPVFFLTKHNYVSKLVAAALPHCISWNGALAAAATQHLYLLCCTNASLQTETFPRMKIQLTIALSQFVSQGIKEDDSLRLKRSLVALRTRAEKDRPGSVFATQIGELISALMLVQSETAGLRAASDDSYRVCDQLLRLAAGHRHAPELRVAWLESLASFHAQARNFAEAAEAHLRVAALVYSCVSLPGALPRSLFINASPNLKEEFDSIPKGIDTQTFESPAFGAEGFMRIMDSAVQALLEAQLYERANDASKIIVAFLEATRDYTRLVDAHARLQSIFEKLAVCARSNVRQLGSYYRVTLFGSVFGELDGQAYVYREAKLMRLGEMRERLEQVFQRHVPEGKQLQVVTDAKDIDRSRLDPSQYFVQITSVEPVFEGTHLQAGHTDKFMFETPYTLDGQTIAASISEQYKRKVILKTERPFPDLAMRSKVISRTDKTCTPIENSIEALEQKTEMMQREVASSSPSIKFLQMALQGSLRPQVNAGPQEICRAFLGSGKEFPAEQIAHLRPVFRNFLLVCSDALQVNRSLIGPEQMAFHQELEQGFKQLTAYAAEHGITLDKSEK